METYLKNIKNSWKIYKDGRWVGNIGIYYFIFTYTIKYIKNRLLKKLQTLILIIAPSYFIGRFLIGIIFNI